MELISIEKDKNNIVKKHNELVRNARYSLNELSIKVVSSLISMIKTSDTEFQEYHLSVKDFQDLTGAKNLYKNIDKTTTELMSNPFIINNEKFNWCSYAKYKEGQGFLILEISPKLRPYLLELKKDFLQYNIKDILSLKSSYVIRLYELIMQEWQQYKKYNSNEKSFSFELDLEELRELLEVPKSYQYVHFRERIIDKAKAQFKEKTNIKFDYEEIKLGRKVVKLLVEIKENIKGANDFLEDLESFKKYIRTNFVDVDLDTKENQVIACNKKGQIYEKLSGKILNKKKSDIVWGVLYKIAKEGKLYAIKQGKLF